MRATLTNHALQLGGLYLRCSSQSINEQRGLPGVTSPQVARILAEQMMFIVVAPSVVKTRKQAGRATIFTMKSGPTLQFGCIQ